MHNIIGKFNVATNAQQPIFILAGHYDTLVKKGFIGANDGGSKHGDSFIVCRRGPSGF